MKCQNMIGFDRIRQISVLNYSTYSIKKIKTLVTTNLESSIVTIRGLKVILDADLAMICDVPTKRLNEQMKRNAARFPEEFMFQLTKDEMSNLRSQFVTSSLHGGRRYLTYAFTEHGAIMAANDKKEAS